MTPGGIKTFHQFNKFGFQNLSGTINALYTGMESKDEFYHAGDWIIFWDEMTHSYQHLRGFARDNLKPIDIGQRPQLIEINSIPGNKIISPSD